MLPKRGIKRQRSDGMSELASTVSTRSTKTSAPKPVDLVPNSPAPAFAVFNDPVDTTSQPRRNKRARLDRLSTKSTNKNSLGEISPIRLVPVPAVSTSTAPSLKDRLAFSALTLAASARIPSLHNNSQIDQSMVLFPRMAPQSSSQGPSGTAFFTSPDGSLTPKKALRLPPSLLKSPFRPVSKPTDSKGTTKPALMLTIRRPSESTALRRPLAAREVHRRPSDSYGYGRRPRPSSFMKNLPLPARKGKLTRDPSLLDALQKPVPRTPPNRNTPKSPSVLPSSEAHLIPPIPHVMMQIDTPGREAEQIVADMSQFSLEPKHDNMISSPVQKAVLRSNNNHAVSEIPDEYEVQYQPQSTQSSPGIEVPSQDDSWCHPAVSQSSPIKSILPESSDPLDMFHPIRFPPIAKRLVMGSRVKSGADTVSGSSMGGIQGFKRFNKVYGKRTRKSVHFGKGDGRNALDDMDLSEDELLLK